MKLLCARGHGGQLGCVLMGRKEMLQRGSVGLFHLYELSAETLGLRRRISSCPPTSVPSVWTPLSWDDTPSRDPGVYAVWLS